MMKTCDGNPEQTKTSMNAPIRWSGKMDFGASTTGAGSASG
jgi:hypothetical protein